MARQSSSSCSLLLLLPPLLIAMQFCARGAAQLSHEECLRIDSHDDNSMRVTVDCTSKPSYAYLTISGITEDVFFMAVFYSCNIGNETVFQGSEECDDVNEHISRKNYNISVPVDANCSFTVCYEGSMFYELMRGTTATCLTALPSPSITVKVDPPSALLAVGTPIVFRCSVNATVTPSISWSNGTDQLTEKEGSGGDDRERTIEITYHSTGVKKIVCSVKDDSSEHVIKATAKITVVESLFPLIPRNLSYSTNSSSLRVVWQSPATGSNGLIPLRGFNFVVRNKSGFVKNSSLTIYDNSSSNYSIELHGLEKFVPYTVEVTAYNKYGYGKPASIPAFVEQGVPVVPPRNITIKRLNNTAIRVRWLPLTLEEAKGFVTNYTIYYQETANNHQETHHHIVVPAQQDSVTINNLKPLREYSVEVSAFTSVGEGLASNSTPETNSKSVRLCFIVSSCHHWEASGGTLTLSAPSAGITLITSYLKQTCGTLFPISRAVFTCANYTCQQQSYLSVHAHILSSNTNGVTRQLTSCIQNMPHLPQTIDGVKITLSNSCRDLQNIPCSTYTSTALPSSLLSSTHPVLRNSATLVSVVVVAVLTLTVLVSTCFITLIVVSKRKTAQPQEFADYIPNVDSSNYSRSHQEKITSFTQIYLPTSIKSFSTSETIEKLKISAHKQNHICRQASQDSMISVTASNNSSRTEQLQVSHCKSLSNNSFDREETSHHVIHIR